jgi:hypothetical protein
MTYEVDSASLDVCNDGAVYIKVFVERKEVVERKW